MKYYDEKGKFLFETEPSAPDQIALLERQVRDIQVTAIAEATEVDRLREELAVKFNDGIEACMSRLYEMNRICSGRHNYYLHAAIELAKLKDEK